MEKIGKAGAMFWGGVVVVFELLIFLGLVATSITEKNFAYSIVAILPLLVGAYTAYFIRQRLKEIDLEKEKKDEYEKY